MALGTNTTVLYSIFCIVINPNYHSHIPCVGGWEERVGTGEVYIMVYIGTKVGRRWREIGWGEEGALFNIITVFW
jgi:hypothetical protein